MKKSILALLMLVCLCTLFSCGGGSGELAKFSKSLKKAEPKAVVSTITVTSADGSQVLDMTASVSDGNDNAATLDMDYYPLFGFDENGNAVIPNGVTE